MSHLSIHHPVRAAVVFSSPLQIRNASQALDAYGVSPEECLKFFLPGNNEENRLRCHNLMETLGWKHALEMGSPTVKEAEDQLQFDCEVLSSLAVIEWIIKSLPSQLDYVFMGDYRPRMFLHIVNLIKPRQTVLLDDGSIVPEIADYRIHHPNPIYRNPEVSNHRRRFGLKSFDSVRFQLSEVDSLEFFTIYRIKLPMHDRIRSNRANRNSLVPEQMPREKQIWVIGTNHVEEGITTPGKYYAHLGRIAHFYRGYPLVYCAHRREHPQKLFDLAKLFKFEILHSEEGVEAEIMRRGKLPARIATIVSTVTDTLGDMGGGRFPVDCFIPSPDYLKFRRRGHIQAIIAYQRLNQHRNTHFWRAADMDKGGFVDPKLFELTELIFSSASPVVGLPLDKGCSWLNQEGQFARDIEVEIENADGLVMELMVVDSSQPYLHVGDEYFLIDSKGHHEIIRLDQVRGLSLIAMREAGNGSAEKFDPTLRGSPHQIRPRWRHAVSVPGRNHLPLGLPLGKGTRYAPTSEVKMLGLKMECQGGEIKKMNGFVMDPWGSIASDRFSENPTKDLKRLRFHVTTPLVEGEHFSFILHHGGREGLCVRIYPKNMPTHAGNLFVDLTHGQSQTVELNDDFTKLAGSIVMDRLYGNWMRITITGGSKAKELGIIEFLLQNRYLATSSFYQGSPSRGLILHRVARDFGNSPLLPVYSDGYCERESAVSSPLSGTGIYELNLILCLITEERRFVIISINGVRHTLDLQPSQPYPSWLDLPNVVGIPFDPESGLTSTLAISANHGIIEAHSRVGVVQLTKCRSKTFDFEILSDQLGENMCPMLAGIEVFRKPLGAIERSKCLHRSRMVPTTWLANPCSRLIEPDDEEDDSENPFDSEITLQPEESTPPPPSLRIPPIPRTHYKSAMTPLEVSAESQSC